MNNLNYYDIFQEDLSNKDRKTGLKSMQKIYLNMYSFFKHLRLAEKDRISIYSVTIPLRNDKALPVIKRVK